MGDHDQNKQLFDGLRSRKEAIEAALEERLIWERIDDKRASRVALYRDVFITATPEDLAMLREWAVAAMIRFRQVIDKHVHEVLSAGSSQVQAGSLQSSEALQ